MSADSTPRTIVITGCTRGIGRALIAEFIASGQRVSGCGRNAAEIAKLRHLHPGCLLRMVDVRDDAGVERWAREVFSAHGVPELVINNAALINRNAPLWQVPASEFSDVVDVNVKGVANVVRHFVPAMIARGSGVIVNMSSGWGRSTDAEVAPYCATKFAVEGLSRALAQELPNGLACVALSPGVVDTEMLRSCMGGGASSAPSPEAWAKRAAPYLLGLGARENGMSLTFAG